MATASPVPFEPRKRRWLSGIVSLVVLGAIGAGVYYELSGERDSTSGQQSKEESADKGEAKPNDKGKPAEQVVQLSPDMIRKFGIRIGMAHKRKLTSEIVAPARVVFNSEATAVIGSPVTGRVVEIKARVGDRVEAKSVLLEIESTELGEAQSEFLQRQNAIATAEAAIRPLTEIFARIKKLHDEEKLIGINEVQERELDLTKAEGALETAKSAATAAENKLHLLGMDDDAVRDLLKYRKINPRYVVRSPLAGEVIERLVNLGELVKPDREKLLVVADTRSLCVWADVPESRSGEIAIGKPVEIVTTSGPERSIAATVSHVAASIDAESRALRVRVDVAGDRALKAGMSVQARFKSGPADAPGEAMLTAPQTAVYSVAGKSIVFVPSPSEPNTFIPRPIEMGPCSDGMACITSGLEDGEKIVVAGGEILKADLLKSSAKDED
jgi:cobalt-zinc-cadmium efflux system membrane fusion protein